MARLKSMRKANAESVSKMPHGKLSLLRRKLKLRPDRHLGSNVVAAGTRHDEAETSHSKRKKEKPFQRGSPMKLVRLYPYMTEKQKELVSRAGFGGLLDIKCTKIQPELCKYLMQSFNPTTCAFEFLGRGSIPVSEDSVYLVLGVPLGNKDVRYELDSDSISFMSNEFRHAGSNQPTMSSIENKLAGMKTADSTYLRIWTAFAMCSVLAPTTGIHVSPRIYPSLVNIKEASQLNVCKFVIMVLCRAAKKRPNKAIQKACMLYYMVKYVDSLDLEGIEVSSTGTRVSAWTNAMVKEAVTQDMNPDGTFGRAPLKSEFVDPGNTGFIETDGMETDDKETIPEYSDIPSPQADKTSNYSANPEEWSADHSILFPNSAVFANFIDMNVHGKYTKDGKNKLSQAVQQACISFEKILQSMVNALIKEPVVKKKETVTMTPRSQQGHCCSVQHDFHPQRRERRPVVKKKVKAHEEEDAMGTQSCELSESVINSDDDYEPDEEQDEMADTPVSLDEESFDIGRSSSKPTIVEKRRKKPNVGEMAPPSERADTTLACDVNLHDKKSKNAPSSSTPTADDHGAHQFNSAKQDVSTDNTTSDTKEASTVDITGGSSLFRNENVTVETETSRETEWCAKDIKQWTETTKEVSCSAKDIEHRNRGNASHVDQPVEKNIGDNMDRQVDAAETLAKLSETYKSTSTTVSTSENSEGIGKDGNNTTMEGTSKINFLEFVKYSAPPKYNVPTFETPVFLDLEGCTPMKETTHNILSGLAEMKHNDADKLPSYLTGSPRKELKKLLSEIEPSLSSRKRKSVSFASQPELQSNKSANTTTSPNRYRTRAAVRVEIEQSPIKDNNIQRRTSPRLMGLQNKVAENQPHSPLGSNMRCTRAKASIQNTATETATPQEQKCRIVSEKTLEMASPILQDSMIRRLSFGNSASEKRKELIQAAPDAPSFDLGFDTQSEDNEKHNNVDEEGKETNAKSSNASVTPVAHEYNKRLTKPAKFAQSPYLSVSRSFTVSKATNEFYNLVIKHGPTLGSPNRKETIIDVGVFFVNPGDLVDSVAPGEQMINVMAEIGIHIIKAENKNKQKNIMPLRISNYLIECRFELKDVQRVFTITPTHRLDHNEIVCFPTLRSFGKSTSNMQMSTGHYFLVNLNLKAERFEVMDSIVRNGEPLMMEYCHYLIASIKSVWNVEYKNSRIDISNFPIEIIPCPQQTNTYDCGFFMLQLLEEWHGGRRVQWFDQKDMLNIRKLLCEKWVRWHENRIKWQLVI